jgi:tetratricopeptide (TPR) repeat protein
VLAAKRRQAAGWTTGRRVGWMRSLGVLASVLSLLTGVRLLTDTAAQAASKRDHANCDAGEAADKDTVIASCSRIISDRRESPKARAKAYFNRGMEYYTPGDYDRAIADFSDAIKLVPRERSYYVLRGGAYFRKGDHDRAIADYSEAIRVDGRDDYGTYDARGDAYLRKGDYDSAIADYSEAIRLVMQSRMFGTGKWWTPYYNHRGAAFRAKGDYDRAIADHSKAIELVPTRPEGHRGLGLVRYFKGDFKGAAADLKRAIDLDANAYETAPGNLYVLLFHYLASERAGEKAAAELDANARRLKGGEWPYPAVELFLGRRTPAATLDAAGKAEQRCEAHFYVGMWHLLKGDSAAAEKGLAIARDTCPRSFWEYGAAVVELARLQAPAPPAPPAPIDALELEFWRTVKDSGSAAMLEAYLDKFPNGSFAPLARIKLKELSERARQ